MTTDTTPKPLKPPPGLTGTGRASWTRITKEFSFRPDELVVLEMACRTESLIERLAAEMGDAPTTVKGSRGQDVLNPLVSEIRMQRLALARLWRQLSLPDDDETERRKAGERSVTARQAAEARWKL